MPLMQSTHGGNQAHSLPSHARIAQGGAHFGNGGKYFHGLPATKNGLLNPHECRGNQGDSCTSTSNSRSVPRSSPRFFRNSSFVWSEAFLGAACVTSTTRP